MFSVDSPVLTVPAHIHGYVMGFPVSDTMMMSFINLLLFGLLCFGVHRMSVLKPGKVQLFFEMVYTTILSFITSIAGSEKAASRILPIVMTLVLFILVSNLSSTFLPFLGAFTFDGEPVFRSSTNDFNMTLALAVGMVVLTQIYSIAKINIFRYLLRFVKLDTVIIGFRKGIGAGLMSIIDLFLGILDTISEIAKVVSLSLRLFGNMFAGELLTGIFMGMIAILLPIPIMGLSLLSGVVQSVVFGALVTSYLAGVLED